MPRTILLIEDNPDNMDLVSFLLTREGHSILKAFNGIQGLDLAKQAMPDLIILDLAMPEMDGWQTAKLLKQDPHTKDIPIIALTAYTLPGDKQQALDSGCDGYLSKPLHVANFATEVATYFVH
jgi:two-component system cell cycle response regulator DivK